eukprot:2467896-Rhodomonas_salina.1
MSGTEKAYFSIGLRACYAMSGTEIAYVASRDQVQRLYEVKGRDRYPSCRPPRCPRNQKRKTALAVQFVPGMRVLAFDFAVQITVVPFDVLPNDVTTQDISKYGDTDSLPEGLLQNLFPGKVSTGTGNQYRLLVLWRAYAALLCTVTCARYPGLRPNRTIAYAPSCRGDCDDNVPRAALCRLPSCSRSGMGRPCHGISTPVLNSVICLRTPLSAYELRYLPTRALRHV